MSLNSAAFVAADFSVVSADIRVVEMHKHLPQKPSRQTRALAESPVKLLTRNTVQSHVDSGLGQSATTPWLMSEVLKTTPSVWGEHGIGTLNAAPLRFAARKSLWVAQPITNGSDILD